MPTEPILLTGKIHDLGGGMQVRRVLPQIAKRSVGPFVFFDHLGPLTLKADQNSDVRPHPHIGLSTLTYLMEGRMVHRDSLGSVQSILPGEVNWMTAGSGISHSERSFPEDRIQDRRMHGLQFWVALPKELEEIAPSFQHYGVSEIPVGQFQDFEVSVIAGELLGLGSKVKTTSPLVLAKFVARGALSVDLLVSSFELGIYSLTEGLVVNAEAIPAFQMVVLPVGVMAKVASQSACEFIMLGGEPLAEPRAMVWNFVASSREKIEKAKLDWKNGTFPMVPGETEFFLSPD